MLADFLKDNLKIPPHVAEILKTALEVEFFGLGLPELSAIGFLLITVIFFFPGRDKRPLLHKLGDFLFIWLCLFLFTACIVGGFLLGHNTGQTAIGGFAGLFMFWFIFNALGIIKTRIRAREERETLAKILNKKN